MQLSILNPPESWKRYRAEMANLSGEDLERAQERFRKSEGPAVVQEVMEYARFLDFCRSNLSLPIEKVEIRNLDGKKTGTVVAMMVYDITYRYLNGEIREANKVYLVDQGVVMDVLKKKSVTE